jgi:hypothetical protein
MRCSVYIALTVETRAHTGFCGAHQRVGDHLEDLGIGRRIILKLMFKK